MKLFSTRNVVATTLLCLSTLASSVVLADTFSFDNDNEGWRIFGPYGAHYCGFVEWPTGPGFACVNYRPLEHSCTNLPFQIDEPAAWVEPEEAIAAIHPQQVEDGHPQQFSSWCDDSVISYVVRSPDLEREDDWQPVSGYSFEYRFWVKQSDHYAAQGVYFIATIHYRTPYGQNRAYWDGELREITPKGAYQWQSYKVSPKLPEGSQVRNVTLQFYIPNFTGYYEPILVDLVRPIKRAVRPWWYWQLKPSTKGESHAYPLTPWTTPFAR